MSRFFTGWAVFLALSVFGAAAPAGAAPERRVALVIGNSTYQQATALPNPKNDANDFAETLRSVGFEVISVTDVDKRGMDTALARFSRAARGASVALFYFAGHGMQFNGMNYILPVDARLEDEVGLRYESVSLEQVRTAVDEASGVKIMILDACRNNPLATNLARSFIGTSRAVPMMRGLARVEQSTGTVVAYATQANQVAEDGGGRNSPFTTALIENLKEPGVEIGSLFRRVASSVYERTQGRQVPELSISLLSDFYLNQNESDMQAWARLRDSNDVGRMREFIERYPRSLLVDAARTRLDLLETASRDRYAREERELRERLAALQRERAAASEPGRAADSAPVVASGPSVTITPAPVPAPSPVVAATPPSPAAPVAVPQAQTVASLTPSAPAPAPEPARAAPMNQPQTAVLTPPVAPVAKPADDTSVFNRFKVEMRRLGCFSAANDLSWKGAGAKKALSAYAKEAGLTITPLRLNADQVEGLETRETRLCPSVCNVRQTENAKGQCVAKTCGRGETLARNGECVERQQRAAKPPAARQAKPRAQPAAQRQPVAQQRQRRVVEEPIETVRRSCSPGVSVGFGFGPVRLSAPVGRSC